MNNEIILATGANELYFQTKQFQNYLSSIEKNSNFNRNILIYLGKDNIELQQLKIELSRVDPISIVKKNPNNCLQHGEFLNAECSNTIKDSDIIVFTDGDMTLQRGLKENEMTFLRHLKDNDVYVTYNGFDDKPAFNLIEEAFHFGEELNKNWVSNFNENLFELKCYNTGVLCMNKKTWIRLKNLYIEKFDLIDSLFKHYAKQQWLISYILQTKGFNVHITKKDFHASNHYKPSNRMYIQEGNVVKTQDAMEIVLFKHFSPYGVSWVSV